MERLFVAVRPPEAACAALRRLELPTLGEVRWVAPRQWHVTLAFLGSCEPAPVLRALRGAPLPSCEAVMGPRVSTLGERVIVVPVSGLDRLARAVRAASGSVAPESPDRPFRGHLTLGRLRGSRRLGAIDPPIPVIGERVAARWRPDEVELVSSVTDPGGAIHEVIARVPVGG